MFGKIIDSILADSLKPTSQGKRFERLVLSLLQKEQSLRASFDIKSVYLWDDFSDIFGINRRDFGIDIVIITHKEEYIAVQCKAYKPSHKLVLADLKNFLAINAITDSQNKVFCQITQSLIFHTCKTISTEVENALAQNANTGKKPASHYGYHWLQNLNVKWNLQDDSGDITIDLPSAEEKKALRDYQQEALKAIHNHFVEEKNARGKVIMACGTGKSLLSIRTIDSLVDSGELALVLTPSLALTNQLIHEFFAQSESEYYKVFAVCSDSKVGKATDTSEDIPQSELCIPPTTDPIALSNAVKSHIADCKESRSDSHCYPSFSRLEAKSLDSRAQNLSQDSTKSTHLHTDKPKIIIFSTYQSLQVVIDAKLPPFKLILNDEAHRTAGVQKITAQGEVREISVWQKTHDNDLLPASYRLYLTATPRIYNNEKVKEQLDKTKKEKNLNEDLLLFSMDDEKLFGSEIYRLDFAKAIDKGILSDFRVVISYVSEEFAAEYLGQLTKEQNLKLDIESAGKMVALANAINKHNISYIDESGAHEEFRDKAPMKRAVAFHSSIRDSKFATDCFNRGLISRSIDFEHIDGKDNASIKAQKLSWLKESSGNTRVLSNARCLTEGIDVPNLDAVCFFDKRDSVVDVVQAVGRAIRKADGKKYGYIILPLMLTEKEIAEYDNTLKGKKFKVVWEVLKALRSHDGRLIDSARINEILQVCSDFGEKEVPEHTLFALEELFKEMRAAVPKNLGDLQYWEHYASNVGNIMRKLSIRIQTLTQSSPPIKALFNTFCKALQSNLNASFNESEAIALIAQHIITKPIFSHIFPDLDFASFDKVSAELEKLHHKLLECGLESETKDLEKFYAKVQESASYARSDSSKQSLIKNLYDTLFKEAFKKTQEKLGIVYTPIEGVDFIIHSVQYLLSKHFGKSLADEDVHIYDPFTGTGTFITRTIQSGYLDSNLESKYDKSLWANEITLLGYYIAQINIATSYHERITKLRSGHSVLSDKSGSATPCSLQRTPSASHSQDLHNPDFSSQSLECQDSRRQDFCENASKAEERTSDSKIFDEKGESTTDSKAEVSCDGFGSFQAQGAGSLVSLNDQAARAESPKSAQETTPQIKLFDNLLFTDTFNTYTPDSRGFVGSKGGTQTTTDTLPYLAKNYAKIQELKSTSFKVIISNPPYSAGQKSGNDNNANEKYPHIDKRITETYRVSSLATSTKNNSFDSLKRALRYASDRIESSGIVGFVMNASFIDGNSDDGLRACLEGEFDYIYIFNLRGNQRTQGEQSRKEGGKFFDSGSRTPVALAFFVKTGQPRTQDHRAQIFYHDIGDYLTREQKLNIIQNFKSLESMEQKGLFKRISPNKDYDWINQRDYSFMAFTPLGSTKQKLKPLAKNAKGELELEIFEIFSSGAKSNRDFWVYNFSYLELEKNMRLSIATFNNEGQKWCGKNLIEYAKELCDDETKISWSDVLKSKVKSGVQFSFDKTYFTEVCYYPFCKTPAYYDKNFFHSLYKLSNLYPFCQAEQVSVSLESTENSKNEREFNEYAREFYDSYHYLPNIAICISGGGEFSSLMSNLIPDYSLISTAQNFPLYYYERVDSKDSSAKNGQMTMNYESAQCNGVESTNDSACDERAESARDSSDSARAYFRRKDAIRDEALAHFRKSYGDESISKEQIFYYIYALLNHPEYKAKYADNLSKMLPRIPLMREFGKFVSVGRELAGLHLGYEGFCDVGSMSAECGAYACLVGDVREQKQNARGLFANTLKEKSKQSLQNLSENDFRVKKMTFYIKGERDVILFNEKIAIVNIPSEAYEYKVNGKSAIEWILDRYQVSTDKKSTITNDPNLYESTSGALKGYRGGKYALALLLSVIEMSYRTSRLIKSLPKYELLESKTDK